MPINLGEAIGLGSKQRIRSGELTQAANRFIQLDQQKRARQAAKEAEDQKYADEIYKSLTLKVGKLNQPRTEEAMRTVSEFAVNTRNKEGKIDRLKAQTEFEKATARLQALNKEQETDDNNAKVYQTNRNAFGGIDVLQYEDVIKNHPYLATRIYQDSGFNVPVLRNVQYVDPTEFEDKVVNTLKEQIKPTSTGTVIGGDIITERKLTEEQAKDLAAANIGDGSTNYAISLYNTQKPEIFRRAEEKMQKDPNLSGDLAITSAMIDLSSERMLGQGAWFDKSRPRSSGGGGGKTPEEQGWNIDVQASNLAYEEQAAPTNPYDKLLGARKGQKKGDVVGFSKDSGRSENDYLPFVNSIPKVIPPAADESTKKTVLTYKGGNVTNTDILYFVQDPITRKWFAKVSDETASKMFGERLLASAGLVPISERDYATIASSYKKSKNFIVNLFNKASAQYLPKTGGTTSGKTTDYGLRNDGVTQKGGGWLGALPVKGGGVATEFTTQSDAVKVNGKRIDFPTLVPTLTKQEVDLMVNDIIPNNKQIPENIMQKAITHAKKRLAEGKSVFKEEKAEKKATTENRSKNEPSGFKYPTGKTKF